MGDLEKDTTLDQVGEERFTARFSRDWEIWGPMGGYVAAVALRAAGAHCGLPRPVSFMGHYLSVGAFDQVDVETTTLRAGRRTASVRVSISQQSKPVLEALVWASDDSGEGLEHEDLQAPDVPDHAGLPTLEDRIAALPEEERWDPGFTFWRNIQEKPAQWIDDFDAYVPKPEWIDWFRFRPIPTFADPWVDACRLLIILDVMQWPAASRGHGRNHGWMAPSLDLAALFHRPASDSEWLLGRGHSPVATAGLVGGDAQVWNERRQLVATGRQQMLCRPVPRRPD